MFDNREMLDVAIRNSVSGTVAVDLGGRSAPPLPVHPALTAVLPGGLRRGSTVTVGGSLSLLLALLGAASADGAWCALVGFPRLSAEAAVEYGLDLTRTAIVPAPGAPGVSGASGASGASWTTAVGALLDAVDMVAARPPARLAPGDVRRLAARTRTRDAVLISYGEWAGADVRLRAGEGQWSGIGAGTGRLRARVVEVHAEGRGSSARPRSTRLWLPAQDGAGVQAAAPIAEVVDLAG